MPKLASRERSAWIGESSKLRTGPDLHCDVSELPCATLDRMLVPHVLVLEVVVETQLTMLEDLRTFFQPCSVRNRGIQFLGQQRKIARELD